MKNHSRGWSRPNWDYIVEEDKKNTPPDAGQTLTPSWVRKTDLMERDSNAEPFKKDDSGGDE
jgi:hypothetical protein